MSRDERDKPGGHAVRHPGLLDCRCCEALDLREDRLPRVARKRLELQRRLAAEEPQWIDGVDDPVDAGPLFGEHAFVAGRCIRCGTDHIDAVVYEGLEVCEGRAEDDPISYSTSTGQDPVSSHAIEG